MALTTKEINARRRKRRLDNHECVKCGKPLDREGVLCTECLKITNEESRQSRAAYKAVGICPRCRKYPIMGDEAVCPECRARATNNVQRNREEGGRESYNEYHNEWSKKAYAERAKNGVCTRCGKRKAQPGYKTCSYCREKQKMQPSRVKRRTGDRSGRYLQGLCYFCDNPVKPGYKVCEEHYQRNLKNARSQKATQARKDMVEKGILY